MSESEILQRREYKRNRKKWTTVQLVAIFLLAAIALGSFMIYNRMNQTYYVECVESSSVEYQAQYSENPFFDNEWIGKDQTYISSLIKKMTAVLRESLMISSTVGNFPQMLDAHS